MCFFNYLTCFSLRNFIMHDLYSRLETSSLFMHSFVKSSERLYCRPFNYFDHSFNQSSYLFRILAAAFSLRWSKDFIGSFLFIDVYHFSFDFDFNWIAHAEIRLLDYSIYFLCFIHYIFLHVSYYLLNHFSSISNFEYID